MCRRERTHSLFAYFLTMTSTPGSSSHGNVEETAVPTLKVMRLQSPDLSQVRKSRVTTLFATKNHHAQLSSQPTAGSLDNKCLLGSALALPDSFGGKKNSMCFGFFLVNEYFSNSSCFRYPLSKNSHSCWYVSKRKPFFPPSGPTLTPFFLKQR